MRFFRLALLCSFLSLSAFAQNPFQIKGTVTDTASNAKLYYATISVLNAKDSTLFKFARADEDGKFSINSMKKGDFILLITYPEYADFVSTFKLDSTTTAFDFKQIDLKSKARVLNEVLIKGQVAAIKIKGDTTEFNAGSYAIQPNDKVEDLLKKLPGIQVDKDGKITAQGKSVPKVLVDGEEFFGDDPTLVTKNLRADMVDKVQLYDKSSDQAAFTGVDDGEKTTTINIKLKENMKKGYFGKADVGYGTKDFYEAQLAFNLFKAKQKFSAYGTTSNDGKTGLGWEDASKYGSDAGGMQVEGDNIYFTGGEDEIDGWSGRYDGQGIPRANNGGFHYDSKWNKDKETINTNYKIGELDVNANRQTINQNNLPTGLITTNSDEVSDKYIFRQKLDAVYSIKLDTTSNLKVTVEGSLKSANTESFYNSVGRRIDNSIINSSSRSNTTDGDEQGVGITAFYNKKLKKLGRNFSVTVSQKLNEKDNSGFLNSDNEFYDETGTMTRSEIVDQYKTNNTKVSILNTNVTYNEPITKSISLVANYGFSLNNSESDRKSFNASAPGNYNVLDTEFSNDFEATQYINQGGAIFNYKKPKTTLNLGTKVNSVTYRQYEAISNQRYNRSFVNWLPQLNYTYKFSAQKSLRLGYNGSSQQPTVEQLQPVKVNTDPFNIPLGNPDLRPSFSSRFNASYNSYKVLSEENLFFNGSINFTQNNIVSNTQTDAEGKSVYQSVNLTGKTPFNYYFYSRYGRKVKFLGFNAGVGFSGNASTNYNFVNTELNTTKSESYSPSVSLNKYTEKLNFYLSFGPSYNAQVSSLQPERANRGWGRNGYGGLGITLPKKIKLNVDANYTYTPSSAAFDTSFEQFIVNASASKAFFKKEELKFVIKGNDLFNQNRGFSRNSYSNMITQTSYNNINRYFMFSLVWDFSKMGPTAAATK